MKSAENLLHTIPPEVERPWYMKNGQIRPRPLGSNREIFPEEKDGDRIIDQLMYTPDEIFSIKKVLLWDDVRWTPSPRFPDRWGSRLPKTIFENCPVSACELLTNRTLATAADLIIFSWLYFEKRPSFERPKKQLWMIYNTESPSQSAHLKEANVFNWTSTYRSDSTVVIPYGKWEYYNPNIRSIKGSQNPVVNKTKKVAWIVSNCGVHERDNYVKELRKHIEVDQFGGCNGVSCGNLSECEQLISSYKFYLAFENSKHPEYITEKAFRRLRQKTVPVVMGASIEDYTKQLPENSFIHVDQFESAAHLASYLHKLDKNDSLYNEHLDWIDTGEFIDSIEMKFCRYCAVLHSNKSREDLGYYEDINKWYKK